MDSRFRGNDDAEGSAGTPCVAYPKAGANLSPGGCASPATASAGAARPFPECVPIEARPAARVGREDAVSTSRSRPRALALPFAIVATFSIACVSRAQAAGVITRAEGANAAAIQATVDAFRAGIGGANNGVGPPAAAGRREINWDGVPDSFSAPNFLPPNFFNANSARGAVFSTTFEDGGTGFNSFLVSARASSALPVRFADINPQYATSFQTFSAERLFTTRNGHVLEVQFFVPGTNTPAVVSGFGVVFADVDSASGVGRSVIRCVNAAGDVSAAASAPVLDGGLSFVGIRFDQTGEGCARVIIIQGKDSLLPANIDGGAIDVVAMDDFIYGEPQPIFNLVTAP